MCCGIEIGIHGTTYGGNPLACTIAESVIDIVNTNKVLLGVKKRFQQIISELHTINKRFNCFQDIRGRGLLIGIVLKQDITEKMYKILHESFVAGVIILNAGNNVIRLTPSLIITKADIVEGMRRFCRALEKSLL